MTLCRLGLIDRLIYIAAGYPKSQSQSGVEGCEGKEENTTELRGERFVTKSFCSCLLPSAVQIDATRRRVHTRSGIQFQGTPKGE